MIRKTSKETIAPYLRDASNYPSGNAEEVLIPETVNELIEFLKNDSRFITIAGAGTGLTASRIPSEGIVISMEKFNEIESIKDDEVWLGPAATLKQLQDYLKPTVWFYPPNPTEWNASIGGTLATNASGSRSFKYGVTRDFVNAVDCILVDGRRVLIERGHKISDPLLLDDGSEITFPDIIYTSPNCKNTAGYYVQPEMDWLDLFVGSDGTLGIFVKVCLKLIKKPEVFLSGVLFFEEEKFCWELTKNIKLSSSVSPCSLEYFDRFSLKMLKEKYPNIPMLAKAALFFEEDIMDKNNYDITLEKWIEFLTDKNVLLDDSWFAQDEKDTLIFHEFRHQIPMLVNEQNARAKREKIGTDMAVSDQYFEPMMEYYENTLSDTGIPYVVFGHIGDNHLHINLLPDSSQKELATSLYDDIARKIFSWKGTVSAEHGIGKKKKKYFYEMVGQKNIEDLKKIKNILDPQHRLGIGNIF
ncbi:MAG: FAD-binding oxidoreductase [Nitrospinae bacterium]|nr:FAD-binding oxidoreductase [Nitrospinota bacterium]